MLRREKLDSTDVSLVVHFLSRMIDGAITDRSEGVAVRKLRDALAVCQQKGTSARDFVHIVHSAEVESVPDIESTTSS